LLFVSGLSVRACSGVHNRVRGCFGTVRVVFGYRSGSVRALFGCRDFCDNIGCAKKQNTYSINTVNTELKQAICKQKFPILAQRLP